MGNPAHRGSADPPQSVEEHLIVAYIDDEGHM